MTGDKLHVIGDLRFQLQFSSRESAMAQQEDITAIIRNELLPQAESVFNELASDNETIRIDELEVDLGKISYASMRTEIARHFTSLLRGALTEKLRQTPEASVSALRRLPRAEAELQDLLQFLSSGQLPWQVPRDGTNSFDEMLLRVLETRAADVVVFLRRSATTSALKRLVAQVPRPGLALLLGALLPAYRGALHELFVSVDSGLRSATASSSSERRIWTATLGQLLDKASPTFEQTVEAVEAAMVAESIPVTALAKLPHPIPTKMRPANHSTASLVALIDQRRIAELDRDWPDLVDVCQKSFSEALHISLRRHSARRWLASTLTFERLAEVVVLLSPEAGDWISRVVGETRLFQIGEDTAEPARKGEETERSLKTRLWDYSIAYLVVDRGSRFNKLSYMESLLRHLAAHDNLQYAEMLQSFTTVLGQNAAQQGLAGELAGLVDELIEREAGARSKPGASAATSALETVDILRDFAAGKPTALDRAKLRKLLEQLYAEQPSYLLRLLRELGSGRDSGANASRIDTLIIEIEATAAVSAGIYPAVPSPDSSSSEPFAPAATSDPRPTGAVGASDRELASVIRLIQEREYDQLKRHWSRFTGTQRAQLAYALRRSLHRQGTRRALVAALDDDSLADIVTVMAPEAGNWIASVVGDRRAIRACATPAREPDSSLRTQLWDFSIAYLVVDRGSRFNKMSYMESLLRQLAARDNRQYFAMLQSFAAAFAEFGTQEGLAGELGGLVGELIEREQAVESISGAPETPSALEKMELPAELAAVSHESDLGGNEALPALQQLRDTLLVLPEHSFALLWTEDLLRGAGAGDRAGLRSAMEAFLSTLSSTRYLSRESALAAVERLAMESGKTVRFWQNQFLAFSRRYDASSDVTGDETAASRLSQLLLPGPELQSASHCAALELRFGQLIEAVATRPDQAALRNLRTLFENENDALYLVNTVAERSLAIALERLFPRHYPELRYLAEVMAAAAVFTNSYLTATAARRVIWHGLFDWLICQGQVIEPATLCRDLTARLLKVVRSEDVGELLSRLRARLPRNTRKDAWLWDLDPQEPNPTEARAPRQQATEDQTTPEDDLESVDQIFIENSGIVLLAPYLPRLFLKQGLLEGDAFVDSEAAESAVQLLQFAANSGEDAPEYQLVLNKLLCGIPLGVPLPRRFKLGLSQRETVEGLLKAVVEHWGALGNTSIEGLRSSFLMRQGRLRRVENGWQLLVDSRPFDMLLDALPWSYKLIKYPWMDEVLHVDWR